MIVLSKEKFLKHKKSDTLVIYGSGYSINKLSDEEKAELRSFDSIGFNWFCKSRIPTTFYIVREQANVPKRVTKGETRKILFNLINTYYKKSALIVHHIRKKGCFPFWDNLEKFEGSGIVVRDLKSGLVANFDKTNIFTKGVHHGKCSLCNVLHISRCLGYDKLLFVGIDLYDSRYFWMSPDETRRSIKQKKKTKNHRHPVASVTIQLLKRFKKQYPEVSMFIHNGKSELRKIMPIWEC